MKTKVGDVLEIAASGMDDQQNIVTVLRKWTVVEVYKYHVVCQCGERRESFSYGQLVQMGYEKQAPWIEELREEQRKPFSRAGQHYNEK